jgi:hypothetical protein
MSTKMKNGKVAKSSESSFITADEAFGGTHDIPADIKEHMAKEGWVPRWLNAKQVYNNQGYHPKGWQVYRRPNTVSTDFKFGSDPDGVVRRGDSILGYKTKAQHDKHTAYLDQSRRALAGYKSRQKEEMQALAGKASAVREIDPDEDDT